MPGYTRIGFQIETFLVTVQCCIYQYMSPVSAVFHTVVTVSIDP